MKEFINNGIKISQKLLLFAKLPKLYSMNSYSSSVLTRPDSTLEVGYSNYLQ